MKEFFEIAKKHRHSDSVSILGVIAMTGGYLLAVEYSWEDGSFHEDALFIVEQEYGPEKGQYHLGFTHKVHEYNPPEPIMRKWGPDHPEYKRDLPLGFHPSDWDGREVIFRDELAHLGAHNEGKKWLTMSWNHYGTGGDIIMYPTKNTDWMTEEANSQ